MNQSGNRLIIVLIILILLMTGGTALYRHINKTGSLNGNPAPEINNNEIKLQPAAAGTNKTTPDTGAVKFKTSEDIKVRYGKIEEVYLYNGKKYVGAVLTTDEFYTIVTVDGTFKIPMKDVKLRNIIR